MGEYDYALGPMLLGSFLNIYASGIVGFQFASYHGIPFSDPWLIKGAVLGLFVVDLFQVIITVYMTWLYCVTNYVNPAALGTQSVWTWTLLPLCNAISGIIAHLFLAQRIKELNIKGMIDTISTIGAAAVFSLGTAAGIYGLARKLSMVQVLEGETFYSLLVDAWLAGQFLLDTLIAVTLGLTFYKSRATYLTHLPSKANIITDGVLQSNSVAVILSIGSMLSFLIASNTNAYIVFLLPTGRAYTMAVLNTLISRHRPPAEASQFATSTGIKWANPNRSINLGAVTATIPSSPRSHASFPSDVRNRAQSFSLIHVRTDRQVVIESTDEEKGIMSSSRSRVDVKLNDEEMEILRVESRDKVSVIAP